MRCAIYWPFASAGDRLYSKLPLPQVAGHWLLEPQTSPLHASNLCVRATVPIY